MAENMMCPSQKANSKEFNENYEKIFQKKDKEKEKVSKKEIKKFIKQYAKEHTYFDTDEPVQLSEKVAKILILSRRRREEWLNSIHKSHDMTDWYTDIRSPVGTPRFYGVRQCKNCKYEQIEHPAGRFMDHELKKACVAHR